MGSLRAVFCNCSEFSECSMTSEIDPLRALLSLIYNLLYRIFPRLGSSAQEGSNNKGRHLVFLLFSFFDAITMQGVHGWALHPPAERRISFVLPVHFPKSVEHPVSSSSSKTNCCVASCFQNPGSLFTCWVVHVLTNGLASWLCLETLYSQLLLFWMIRLSNYVIWSV